MMIFKVSEAGRFLTSYNSFGSDVHGHHNQDTQ